MAHAYSATVLWQRGIQPFVDNKYSRGHVWRFDEGVEVAASPSPFVVPNFSVAAAVDPEEAFIASLSFVRAAAIELPRGLRINAVSPAVLVELLPSYGPYFRGHDAVPGSRVANAYVKSVEGALTGQVFSVP